MSQQDLNHFLTEWRRELKDDIAEIKLDVKEIRAGQSSHEARIQVLEESRKSVRWLAGATFVALLGGIADVIVNHWVKHP